MAETGAAGGGRWPELSGPVTGDRPPWGDPGPAAEAAGYVVEEFHMAGTTVGYEPVGPDGLAADGRWRVEVSGEATYRTRLLVVRPADPDRFNGTVLLNWQNVSAGVETAAPRRGEVHRGYAWVGVSAQEVGLYGFPFMPGRRFAAPAPGLCDHDPERYGQLSHPGDAGSFEIFTQAARAVGPDRDGPVDPLGGLDVRRVLATGASQSAMRLVAYLNMVQGQDRVLDGFLLSLWEGRAPAPTDGPVSFGGRPVTARTDLDVAVVVVNSEFEATGVGAVGTVDTDTLRVWEVAGAPHAVARLPDGRDLRGGWVLNPLQIQPVHDAALRHLHTWVAGGPPVPVQPRLLTADGPRPGLVRDELGNAVGGIRLPELAVPVAEYHGAAFGTGLAPLFGGARPFPDDVVRALYSSPAAYRERWLAAVDHLVATEAVLAEDREAMAARVDEVALPGPA